MGPRSRITSLLLLAFVTLGGCVNPTSVIDSKKKQFRDQYPDQVYTYQNGDRQMEAAWSGNPEKRPLLLIHGSPGDYESWAEFLVDLELQKNFHLIAVNRPGYGKSGAGVAEVSLQKQAADIEAVLTFNKSGLPAVLVGHSFGGPVVARMAADFPHQTAGLVFVAASVDPELEEFKWYQNFALWPVTSWMVPSALKVCNDEIMALKKELTTLVPLWSQIRAPSVILHGTKDDLVPPANVQFIKNHLRAALLLDTQLVEGLNHFIPWKRPDLIRNAITRIHLEIEKAPTKQIFDSHSDKKSQK